MSAKNLEVSKIGLGEVFDNLLRINTRRLLIEKLKHEEKSWDRLEEEH